MAGRPIERIPRATQVTLRALAVAPYAAIAAVLLALVPPWQAVGNAALLLGFMAAHATCYRLWQPHAPQRILANELLTRLWFATYVVLIAGLLDGAMAVAALAFPLAFTSWLLHRRLVQGGYQAAQNVLQLGVFLLLLTLLLTAAVP
jgi:hypothetical protein